MKKILNFILKCMVSNYIVFLIIGIAMMPFFFIFGGYRALKESYFDNKDLSYNSYLKCKEIIQEK